VSDDNKVVEFIPRDQWEKQFEVEAQKESPLRLPRELNRKRVVSAFMDAFELLGGTPKLVDWAQASDENYAAFLKLYARLIPSAQPGDMTEAQKYIGHVLPRTKLDQ
jgi:hypothetical protein